MISTLSVRVGSREKNEGGEIFQVALVRSHPKYNPYTYNYDFALLQLRYSINFDGVTKAPIELPELNEPIFKGMEVFVTGWGATQSLTESNRYLRGVTISIVDQENCNNIYKYDGGISDRMVCAAAPGKDSCAVRFLLL